MKSIIRIFSYLLSVAIVLNLSWNSMLNTMESPSYYTSYTDEDIEIRTYTENIIASIDATNNQWSCENAGTIVLLSYIFGSNVNFENKSQLIQMTMPIYKQVKENHCFISLTMPKNHPIDMIPTPENTRIKIQKIKQRRFIAITINGLSSNKTIDESLNKLHQYIQKNKIQTLNEEPVYAIYDIPWIPNIFRKQEILIEVE